MLRTPTIAAAIDPRWARKLPAAPQDFGAAGDGVTDDTAALQAVLDAGRSLWLPEAEYLVTAPLIKAITANSAYPLVYDFGPGIIKSQITSDYVVKFSVNGTGHLLQNVRIANLNIWGGGAEAGGLLLDGGDPASGEYLWLFNVRDSYLTGLTGKSIHVTNNAFEGQLLNVAVSPQGSGSYGIYVDISAGSGVPSSIDVISCDVHGGYQGLYTGAGLGNVNILGGTYIESQREGIYIANAFAVTLSHVHVENNWKGAGSLAAGGAGIGAVGPATIVNCYGTTNQYQQYVVSLYEGAGQTATIIGGDYTGSIVKYANLSGASGGKVTWLGGKQTYDTDGIVTVATV